MTRHLFLTSILFFAAVLPIQAQADSLNYTTPGGYYFTVPANVFSVTATVVGAGGGGGGAAMHYVGSVSNATEAFAGPSGGYQTQTVSVTPGQQIYVEVGAGGCGGHFNYYGADYYGNGYGCPYFTWDGTSGGRSVFGSIISTGGAGSLGGESFYYSGFARPTPGSPNGQQFGPGGGLYGGQTPTGYGYGGHGGCFFGCSAFPFPVHVGGNATNGAVLLSWTTATVPTVISPTATSIGTTNAILGANVTSTGGAPLTARGTCWGTSPEPTTNCLSLSTLTTGIFSHSRSGMPSGTTIYYRGYATNAVGTGYSPTASFTTVATSYILSVTKNGTGTGTVTSNPVGISCGSDCSQTYTQNTSVTLTAAPAVGSIFSGWSGACTGTGTCTVSMTASKSVTATFTADTYNLNVTKGGQGTVTSSPAGISCGTDCNQLYNHGTSVTLTAAPSPGYGFSGWGGDCTGTATTCTVSMTAARFVSATFPSTLAASCSVSPTSITAGGSATWTATASGGTGTYTYSWTGTDTLTGTTASVTKTYSTTGTKTASVTVTSGGVSTTAACGNSLSVGGIPDLTAGATTPTPASPTPGQSTSFSAPVTNSGSATASNFPNVFQIADAGITTTIARVNTGTVASLAAPGSTSISGAYTFASAGTYNVRACANHNTSGIPVISESNTGNNCGAWVTITVSYPTISGSCSVSPATGNIGTTFTWSATASGGNGSYTYSWSGTDGLSGTTQSINKTYATSGTKTGSVTITSAGNSRTFPCSNSASINAPPTVSLTATPSTVDSGQSSSLTWTSTNATSCTGTGFSTGGATSRSAPGVSTGPLTVDPTNYSITCTGTGGSATDNVSITVEQPNASISANPDRVMSGGSSLISWSASQVTSCTTSGPGLTTSTALTGSQTVTNITSPSTYTITCQTNGSPVTDSVTVNMSPVFEEF